jgi:23S rRNA pseudouridine2457 synthase
LSGLWWVDISFPDVLLLFHKPYGVLCQFTPDQPEQKTLADFGFPKGVYPVGRLDMDSEGLLLLCDEPGFNHRFLDPEQGHPRTYWVQVEGEPDQAAMNRLRSGGIDIQGHKTRPCRVELMENEPNVPPRDPPVRFRKSIPTSWLCIDLVEGKNRQVRRMTAAVGFPTLRLIRCRIGGLEQLNLKPGEWRELSAEERRLLTCKDTGRDHRN